MPGGGTAGSNAVAGTKYFGTTMLMQYVDTRCLVQGAIFTIKADIKLVSASGIVSSCNPSSERCPYVGVVAEGSSKIEVAEESAGMNADGFQTAAGSFTVDAQMAISHSVVVFVDFIERNAVVDKRTIVVDNFSVIRVT